MVLRERERERGVDITIREIKLFKGKIIKYELTFSIRCSNMIGGHIKGTHKRDTGSHDQKIGEW